MIEQKQVIRWLQEKDKRAITHLYDNYSAALYGMLFRLVREEALAEDILQEVFVKVWKNGDRFDPSKGTLFTWLARIARNTALNTLQSKSHRNTKKNQSLQDLVNLQENQTLIQHNNVNKIGLTGLVGQLDEKYRIIIDLVYFQGYTQKEIEEHLNIPLGTVKSRLRIALRELKTLFDYERNVLTLLLVCLAYL